MLSVISRVCVVFCFLLASFSINAADYYVKSYGLTSGDGASYDNAWSGLDAVVWDDEVVIEPNVGAGDVLHICGIHPNPFSAPSWSSMQATGTNPYDRMSMNVGASGTEANPLTISFACDDMGEDDSGVIIRANRQFIFNDSDNGNNVDENLTVPTWKKWAPVPDVLGVYMTSAFGTVSVLMEYDMSADPNVVLHPDHDFNRIKRANSAPSLATLVEWSGNESMGYMQQEDVNANPPIPFALFYKPSPDITNSVVYLNHADDNIISIVGQDYVRVVGKNPALDPTQTVTFQETDLLGGGVHIEGLDDVSNTADNIVVERMSFKYSANQSIRLTTFCDDAEISYNRIDYAIQAIYNTNNGFKACERMHIHHNFISHINDDLYWPNINDKHGIQMETGNGHIIEYNHIEFAGSHGIAMDLKGDEGAPVNNNIIRYNYVRSTGSVEDNKYNESGFHLEGIHNNIDAEAIKNNIVHNNIFTGSSLAGIFISSAAEPGDGFSWAFYNNVLHNNTVNMAFQDSFDQTSPQYRIGYRFKNNLLTDPLDSTFNGLGYQDTGIVGHIKHAASTNTSLNLDRSGLVFDNNMYWPANDVDGVFSPLFNWILDDLSDLSGWQASTLVDGPSLDTNSTGQDPMYVNASGDFSQKEDYMLQPMSPAIDNGVDVGVTEDIAGNPIYGLPDQGAYEFQPFRVMGTDSIDIAANIRIYGDGKFRNTMISNGIIAAITITPTDGFSVGDYSQYMDLAINVWETNGLHHKQWTAVTPGSGNATFFIGDLKPYTPYLVKQDGTSLLASSSDNLGVMSFIASYGATTTNYQIEDASVAVDTDGDGVSDNYEQCYDGNCINYNPYQPINNPEGTDIDINKIDTDGDGWSDRIEAVYGSSAIDLDSLPVIPVDGDVNLDGLTQANDILLVQRHILGLATLNEEQIAHADYRPQSAGDGSLTLADMIIFLKNYFAY
ncbi:MAG TPA: hypothetical protein EYO59_04345 [Chromatiaceae bacterium]|nr:hypothetical protein [Chromatiaceae bacterium]